MTQITVRAEGIEIVQKKLQDFNRDIPRVGAGLIYGRLVAAQRRITKYPPIAAGRKQPFRSEKSRRWFFAALRRGEIQVPYQRTGTYARAWKLTKNPSSLAKSGYTLSGNATQRGVNYTALVGGDAFGEGQARFHEQGGWPVAHAVIEEEIKDLPKEIEGGLVFAARRIGL